MDIYFGGYGLCMLALATWGWQRGDVSWSTPATVFVALAFNLAWSQLTLRFERQRAFRLELFRSTVINTVLCPLTILGSDGKLLGWPFTFFAFAIGQPTMIGLFYNRPLIGRAIAVLETVLYLITCAVLLPESNWYELAWQAGLMLMLGLYSAQVMTTLGRSLKLEAEKTTQLSIEKNEILSLHRQLDLQRAKSTQSAKMAALGEMAGGIAHELNTPLATLRMQAELVEEFLDEQPPDTAAVRETTRRFIETIDRMASIIHGLRTFSRPADRDPTVPSDIARIVRDTLSLCESRFSDHGVEVDLTGMRSLQVRCRPVQISQVLLNLLNNSFDAIHGRADAKWIRITARPEGKNARITVSDCGTGIQADIRDKIFQPFFTTKDFGRGTGLGLSISKGLVEADEGLLELDPEAPHTTFSLTLPLA